LLGRRLGEFLLDAERDFDLGIFGAGDGELVHESKRLLGCGAFAGEFKSVAAGGCFEAYACEGVPFLGGCVVVEGEWMAEPGAGERTELCGRFDFE